MNAAKPFLLLSTREHDAAAEGEYRSTMRVAGLDASAMKQLRLERQPLGKIDLADYSGIILGGSGFCVSDKAKSDLQKRVEADLFSLLDTVIAEDFPFLGMCYGVGIVSAYLGGKVNHTWGEEVAAIKVELTQDGKTEPILAGMPDVFHAFAAHKEAADGLPDGATLLGKGEACPVQLFRVSQNVFASQFHPELDAEDFIARMHIYKDGGYFAPEKLSEIEAVIRSSKVDGSQHLLLENFAGKYRQS
ncbi:MAG: glutamine amidotransferase [Propionibacteriaceae bacterium]|nr:glutamine amidotransferase [Propionibacteriaceae bacterium]